jgi:hypothetical protein
MKALSQGGIIHITLIEKSIAELILQWTTKGGVHMMKIVMIFSILGRVVFLGHDEQKFNL